MKKLAILLFFIVTNIFSQDINIDIKKSEIYRDKVRNTSLLFSEDNGKGGLLVIKTAKIGLSGYTKNYYIEHYNKELKLLKKYTLKNKKRSVFKSIIIKEGIVQIIRFQINEFRKNITIGILSSDLDSLDFIEKELFVLNEENIKNNFDLEYGLFNLGKMDTNRFGDVILSNNKNDYLHTF